MEEKKKIMWRRIAWRTINVIVALLVLVGMFAISVSAGICTIVFSALGFMFGYFCKHHRMQQKFFDAFLEGKDEFFDGKMITVTADDETGAVTVHAAELPKEEVEVAEEVVVTEKTQKKHKKKKEKVQE